MPREDRKEEWEENEELYRREIEFWDGVRANIAQNSIYYIRHSALVRFYLGPDAFRFPGPREEE